LLIGNIWVVNNNNKKKKNNLVKLAEEFKMLISRFRERAGLPDFSCYNIPKRGKIYQITTKYIKSP
jgi:hypothetical protein